MAKSASLCKTKLDQYMEPLIPSRLRDTSPPRTPSSGILDKRLSLRLSGQTLRRWGYLSDGEELVCLEKKRKERKVKDGEAA